MCIHTMLCRAKYNKKFFNKKRNKIKVKLEKEKQLCTFFEFIYYLSLPSTEFHSKRTSIQHLQALRSFWVHGRMLKATKYERVFVKSDKHSITKDAKASASSHAQSLKYQAYIISSLIFSHSEDFIISHI